MHKGIRNLRLPVIFLKEGKRFVAYSPALELSTQGKTFKQVRQRFEEIVEIFFDELVEMGTLEKVLLGLGWKKENNRIIPPEILSHESVSVSVPPHA